MNARLLVIVVFTAALFAILQERQADAQSKATLESRVRSLEARLTAAEAETAKLKDAIRIGPNREVMIQGTNVDVRAPGTITVWSDGTMTLKGSVINMTP